MALTARITVFISQKNLITIDHQSQQATLKSFCFSQEEQVEVAKTALSIAQKLKNIDGVFSIKAASDEVSTNFEDPEIYRHCQSIKNIILILVMCSKSCHPAVFHWLARIPLRAMHN